MTNPSLLHIDSAYRLQEVRAKKHESFFLARHASGLFRKVWSVHPAADMAGSSSGSIDISRLTRDHVVIEGKAALCRLPRILLPLNVLVSQLLLCRVLVRLVRKHQISVIVAVDPFLSGILGLAVARLTGRPLVVRISGNHDDIYQASGALAMPRLLPSYRLQKAVQRFVFRRAALVTGINRNNVGFGLANGASGKTRVLPISSNVAAVHRRPPAERDSAAPLLERLGLPIDRPILLYLGRLLPLKHPDDAIRAMAHAIVRNPRVLGLIVGTGPMEADLRDLARALGVEESVPFLGELDQDELSLLIPRCVMLSPSAGQMALLECALGEAAIVAYDRDFQSEFIEDEVNGLKVPFRDVTALSEGAERLVNDPELASRLGSAARRSALREVDPDRVRQAEWGAFECVLPKYPATRDPL